MLFLLLLCYICRTQQMYMYTHKLLYMCTRVVHVLLKFKQAMCNTGAVLHSIVATCNHKRAVHYTCKHAHRL